MTKNYSNTISKQIRCLGILVFGQFFWKPPAINYWATDKTNELGRYRGDVGGAQEFYRKLAFNIESTTISPKCGAGDMMLSHLFLTITLTKLDFHLYFASGNSRLDRSWRVVTSHVATKDSHWSSNQGLFAPKPIIFWLHRPLIRSASVH